MRDTIILIGMFLTVGVFAGFITGGNQLKPGKLLKSYFKFLDYLVLLAGLALLIFEYKEESALAWGLGIVGFYTAKIFVLSCPALYSKISKTLEPLTKVLAKVSLFAATFGTLIFIIALPVGCVNSMFLGKRNLEVIEWPDLNTLKLTEAISPFGSWKYANQLEIHENEFKTIQNSLFGQKIAEIPNKRVGKVVLTRGWYWSSIEIIQSGGLPFINSSQKFYFRDPETYTLLDNLMNAYNPRDFTYETEKSLAMEIRSSI